MALKDNDFVTLMNQVGDDMVSSDDKHLFVLQFVQLLDKFVLPAQRPTVKRFLMTSLKQFTKSKSRTVHFEILPLWLLLAAYSETMTLKEILDRVDYLYEDHLPYYRAYINELLVTKQKEAALKMLERCKNRCGLTNEQLADEFPSLTEKKTFVTIDPTITIMESMEHILLSNPMLSTTPPATKKVPLKSAIKSSTNKEADSNVISRSVNVLPPLLESTDVSCANQSDSFASSPVCDKQRYPATPRTVKEYVQELETNALNQSANSSSPKVSKLNVSNNSFSPTCDKPSSTKQSSSTKNPGSANKPSKKANDEDMEVNVPSNPQVIKTDCLDAGISSLIYEIVKSEVSLEAKKIKSFSTDLSNLDSMLIGYTTAALNQQPPIVKMSEISDNFRDCVRCLIHLINDSEKAKYNNINEKDRNDFEYALDIEREKAENALKERSSLVSRISVLEHSTNQLKLKGVEMQKQLKNENIMETSY